MEKTPQEFLLILSWQAGPIWTHGRERHRWRKGMVVKVRVRNDGNVEAMASKFHSHPCPYFSGVWIAVGDLVHQCLQWLNGINLSLCSANTNFLYELCPLALSHNWSKQLNCPQNLWASFLTYNKGIMGASGFICGEDSQPEKSILIEF